MNDGWIVIPNWEKFQHYTDRDPPWIKVYTELNSRDDWLQLTCTERGVLITVWTEYARARGVLRVEKAMGLCRPSARRAHFESLNDAGYIDIVASKPLALARSREKKERHLRASPPEEGSSDAAEKSAALKPQRKGPCPECGVGAGLHVAGCSLVRAAI